MKTPPRTSPLVTRLFVKHAGFLFILPGLLGFALFYLVPFAVSVGYSFVSRPVGGEFVGLGNYIDLLQSSAYRLGLRNTVLFMGMAVPIVMALSLGAAMLVRNTGKLKPWFVLVFLVPLVVPSGSMVFFWRILFSNDGALNGMLASLGLSGVNWLGSGYARLALLVIFVWKNLGFNLVLFLAGLGSIPQEYYESARVDGAGALQSLRWITLPCIIPTAVIVVLMSVVSSFRVFREVYLLLGAYPHESVYMLQHFMNNNFFALNYPRLTTATTLLSIAMLLLTTGLLWTEKKVSHVQA